MGLSRGLNLSSPERGGRLKSNVSDFREVMHTLYKDCCAKCVVDVFDRRDLLTIESRIKHEGLSFLTIILPNFARDFEKCLELGFVDPSLFRNFKKSGAIPAFLGGMLGHVFDSKTGRINDAETLRLQFDDVPSIVECVRQICLAFKKVKLPCTPKRTYEAFKNFISTEQSFEMLSLSGDDASFFKDVSSVLWTNLVGAIRLSNMDPKHGPGATADRRTGNQKYAWSVWHERLEPFFPLVGTGLTVSASDSEEFENVTFCPSELESPVKVTPVPKTLKGPRMIAVEPCCMQFAQQGLSRLLVEAIKSNPLTSGHINFDDQGVNGRLALSSSKTRRWATIDLSDASDRVPRDLALQMFDGNADFRDAVDACRSTQAQTPYGLIPLKKFASMGSALCFPVESMYFYTICVGALLKSRNLPVTYTNARIVGQDVYVFGDDIIVPTDETTTVLDHLQKYHCKVNASKTFYRGFFRESCGVDAYYGETVTPVYIRRLCPKNRQQANELISWVATANLFYKKGYWTTAELFYRKVEKILGKLPAVTETSSALGRVTFRGATTISRWSSRYFRFEFKAWVPSSVHRSDELTGYSALFKSLHKLEGLRDLYAERDDLHLERSALYGAVALKRRWVPSH